MGLCPSRNTKAAVPKSQTFTPLEPALTPKSYSLRADAEAFTPKAPAPEKEKEAWESFLDQKKKQQLVPQPKGQTFARKVDGTYTADYRRLLDKPDRPKKYVPPQQRAGGDCDWIKEWKDTKKPRPAPGLPKPKVTPTPPLDSDAKLKAALQKVKQQMLPKDQALEQLKQVSSSFPKDDLAAPSALVPFGLTDAHYLSDTNDKTGSHRHNSSLRTKPRPYAKPSTPELEESMTTVLHCLRQLRSAEQHIGLEQADRLAGGRRYCVGIREVARTLKDKKNCPLKAVLVAPDVEPDCKTVRGSLDERLNDLIQSAQALDIPVVYGLSRTRLGQAIKKSVTISVLGILSTRGMQEPFEQMLHDAA